MHTHLSNTNTREYPTSLLVMTEDIWWGRKYPTYKAYMKSMRVEKDSKPKILVFILKFAVLKKKVNPVTGDEPAVVDHLEEVFKILNGYYFDEDTGEDILFDTPVFGYRMKTFERDGKTLNTEICILARW